MIDLDPQCNLTLFGMDADSLRAIWEEEDPFIDDFGEAMKGMGENEFSNFLSTPKTIHFLLKPTEDGQGDLPVLPPPVNLRDNLDLLPGRLTIHRYENKISERWSGAYLGDALSIRTLTNIRTVAEDYGSAYEYEFVIVDTSPSLGVLNKVIISTVDGFVIPALPDMFSMYGIRNIGSALTQWAIEFRTIYGLISEDKRKKFPVNFVRFLGYTIYNARKYTGVTPWDLARAQFHYAQQIPSTIEKYIIPEVRGHLTTEQANNPIGGTAVMHSHNTHPNMAQKYKLPIWRIPSFSDLDPEDKPTIAGNRGLFEKTREKYVEFANSFLERVNTLS